MGRFVVLVSLLFANHARSQSLISYPYPLHTGDQCNGKPYAYAGISSEGLVCGCSNVTNTWNCGGSGTGNMLSATYDPANYASQVEVQANKNIANGYVGLNGSQGAAIPGGVDTSNGGTNPLEITGLHVASASVPNPATNNFTLFWNSSNSDHTTIKKPDGSTVDLQAGSCTMFGAGGAGVFWPFGVPHASFATNIVNGAGSQLNRMLYRSFTVPCTITVSSMRVYQGTDEAGKHYTFGIYDSTKTLVTNGQCGTITSAATTAKTCAMPAAVTLTPGLYYLAVSQDSTNNTMTMASSNAGYIAGVIVQGATVPNMFYGSTASTGTTTITMPANFIADSLTAVGAEETPHIAFIP